MERVRVSSRFHESRERRRMWGLNLPKYSSFPQRLEWFFSGATGSFIFPAAVSVPTADQIRARQLVLSFRCKDVKGRIKQARIRPVFPHSGNKKGCCKVWCSPPPGAYSASTGRQGTSSQCGILQFGRWRFVAGLKRKTL